MSPVKSRETHHADVASDLLIWLWRKELTPSALIFHFLIPSSFRIMSRLSLFAERSSMCHTPECNRCFGYRNRIILNSSWSLCSISYPWRARFKFEKSFISTCCWYSKFVWIRGWCQRTGSHKFKTRKYLTMCIKNWIEFIKKTSSSINIV